MRRTAIAIVALLVPVIGLVMQRDHHDPQGEGTAVRAAVLAVPGRTPTGLLDSGLFAFRAEEGASRSATRVSLQRRRQTAKTVDQARRGPQRHTSSESPAERWAWSPRVIALKQCESGGDYTVEDSHTGTTYYGAFQANADFWVTYGGDPAYLNTSPFAAPRWMQDLVAYRGFLARGYQPWECADSAHLGYL